MDDGRKSYFSLLHLVVESSKWLNQPIWKCCAVHQNFQWPLWNRSPDCQFLSGLTGSYSSHYLWCNDSMPQMGKSDQVEWELWVLIRSSCSMETESLSLCLKTSKHKFHILKSILNLWRYKCRNNKIWNHDHVCLIINRSCIFTAINEKRLFFLLFASESRHYFSLFTFQYFSRKVSTNEALILLLYYSNFWLK